MAGALLVVAALLLAAPGAFAGAKGLAIIRTRTAVVHGRTVGGARAIAAGLFLVGWATGTIVLAALLLLVLLRR